MLAHTHPYAHVHLGGEGEHFTAEQPQCAHTAPILGLVSVNTRIHTLSLYTTHAHTQYLTLVHARLGGKGKHLRFAYFGTAHTLTTTCGRAF